MHSDICLPAATAASSSTSVDLLQQWESAVAQRDAGRIQALVSGDDKSSLVAALTAAADAADEDEHALTPLMKACAAALPDAVRFLLSECDMEQQWNKLVDGRCAGELIPAGHPDADEVADMLVNAAVRTELLLGVIFAQVDQGNDDDDDDDVEDKANDDDDDDDAVRVVVKPPNVVARETFLATPLRYEEGVEGLRLMTGATAGDANLDDAVMMTWERDIMAMHVERFRAHGCKSVLNVGFGLGIIDGQLEALPADELEHHFIIEAHPDVLAHMRERGWMANARVTVLEGTWQTQLPLLVERGVTIDCVFFDTFETLDDMREFHDLLVNVLAPDGLYSFFNGLAGGNQFFHRVACALAQIQLSDIGFSVFFETVELPPIDDAIFVGCKRRYFTLPHYNLPHVTFA